MILRPSEFAPPVTAAGGTVLTACCIRSMILRSDLFSASNSAILRFSRVSSDWAEAAVIAKRG